MEPERADRLAGQAQWGEEDLSNPHAVADKARRVRSMFAAIAGSYDLNNRLHSMWRDQAWRRKAVRLCEVKPTDEVLDVACGTGDLSLAMADAGPRRVVGIDFTHEMLRIAGEKTRRWEGATAVTFSDGDAMRLPAPDGSFDVVSIAFGIRNVAEPGDALAEFYRVLRPGGRACVLEFSIPENAAMRAAYMFYFKQVMPRTATLISGDRSGAYRYLPRSVNTFLSRQEMVRMMEGAGFCEVRQHPLTFGIAVAYLGKKGEAQGCGRQA